MLASGGEVQRPSMGGLGPGRHRGLSHLVVEVLQGQVVAAPVCRAVECDARVAQPLHQVGHLRNGKPIPGGGARMSTGGGVNTGQRRPI
jgi:hypothetical protein